VINYSKLLSDQIKKENKQYSSGNLYISDLGRSSCIPASDRKCQRQLWHRLNGADSNPLKAGQLLMFQQGSSLEEQIVELLKKSLPYYFKVVATQMDVSLGSPLNGRLDILVADMNSGEMEVIDVKTVRGGAFRYRDEIKETDKFQVAGYIYALRKMMFADITKGCILQVDREGQNFTRHYHFDFHHELQQEIESTITELGWIAESDDPPEYHPIKITVNENKGDDSIKAELPWQCNYCQYRNISCQTAIPKKYHDSLGKVVGHIREGEFDCKIDGLKEYINAYVEEALE